MYTSACVACGGRTSYSYGGIIRGVIPGALGLPPQNWERSPLCYQCWRYSSGFYRTVQQVLQRLEERKWISVGSEKVEL